MTLINVVLPEPLGPTRPKISPSCTSRSTPARACRPPKCLATPLTCRIERSLIVGAAAATTGTTAALVVTAAARRRFSQPWLDRKSVVEGKKGGGGGRWREGGV